MKRKIYLLTLLILFAGFAASSTSAQPFEITESNISNNGGGQASGGVFNMLGAVGQPIATTNGSMGGQFNLITGFITPPPFSTTAAQVFVGGRVLSFNGFGIPRAVVSVLDDNGVVRSVQTNSFGFYRISGLNAGQTYVFTVTSKEFQFDQDTQVFFVSKNLTDINFTTVP